MAEEDRTRRWQRTEPIPRGSDPLQVLRTAIGRVRTAPADLEARRQLRALAAEHGMWDELALLLADEARAVQESRPDVGAAFYEELADVHENLDQSLETIAAMEQVVRLQPDDVDAFDRLAKLYHRAGAWAKAAEAFERVAELAKDDRGRAALRAAGRLYRDHGKPERAVAVYRTIVERRPSDADAWRALDELLAQLGRWREVADVRAAQAERATSDVDKAVLMRGQARALEQAGEASHAAQVAATAAKHAPENVSGIVDYAEVLARSGKGREAADVLGERIDDAVGRGAPASEIAALRVRLADILDGACEDRDAAIGVLGEVLVATPEHRPAVERLAKLLIDEGRRRVTANELDEAVRAFAKATELVPGDPDLQFELAEARMAQTVDRAARDAREDDPMQAETRLRSILKSRPMYLPAVVALADLLEGTDRLDAAAEHLRQTLAAASDDTAPERLAPIVFRYAKVTAAAGDADEAHQLLHEAHHLDRKDLAITLALGESCFARRLWREATLHLGRLAEHPDAPRFAQEVASGLVHAAQAEVRALRPANAAKHYEAAVRIDPGCAKAWQALADAAFERNDTPAAVHALERALAAGGDAPPAATLRKLLGLQRSLGRPRGETCARLAEVETDPRARKDLLEEAAEGFAAAGDVGRARELAAKLVATAPADLDAISVASRIALDAGDRGLATEWLRRFLTKSDADQPAAGGVGDGPRRAELWRRLGDLERTRGNAREALTAYQRAVGAAPDSDGALAARRGLVELAGGAGQPAAESLAAIVESDPEPAEVLAYARELERAHNLDDAHAMFELAAALGATLDDDDREVLAKHALRPLASDEGYGGVLDEAERRALVDDEADAPLAELLDLVGEAANLVCPDARTALSRAGLADLRRLAATRESAAAAMYPRIAKALGGPATLLHEGPRGVEVRLVLAAPPVVLLGPRLAAVRARSHSDIELEETGQRLRASAAELEDETGKRRRASTRDSDADILTSPVGSLPKRGPVDPITQDGELRFRLGRIVELSRARRIFTVDPDGFALLVAALCHAFGRAELAAGLALAEPAVRAEAKRVHDALPVALRRRIADKLASIEHVDPHAYVAACERAADRSGLLACGDARIAIRLAGGADRGRHLARMAASARYLAARRKLRPRRIR